MGDIASLAGFLNEPRIKNRVQTAIGGLPEPFLLREAIDAAGLPKYVVNRVLTRLVRQGVLRRRKARMTYPRYSRTTKQMEPGGRQRLVYLYYSAGPTA